jgi:hypothetical protein
LKKFFGLVSFLILHGHWEWGRGVEVEVINSKNFGKFLGKSSIFRRNKNCFRRQLPNLKKKIGNFFLHFKAINAGYQ